MKNKKSQYIMLVPIFIVLAVAIFGGIYLTRNIGRKQSVVSSEKAEAKLIKYAEKVGAYNGTPVRGTIEFSDEDTTFQELPELTNDSIVVMENTDLYAEIFSSSEKTGSGTDGWLREMTEKFNRSGAELDGTPVSIRLRTVSSGQQVDYVASGKYIPDAISPSNDLSIKMLNAKGVDTEYATESLVTNYAGIVLSSKTYSTLVEEYGAANVQTVAEATADKAITMGYTNPFTSATGLNFLVTLLDSYDKGNISSSMARDGFVAFQKNVPFVALTTTQMRGAAEKGTFDAFVLEYQYFVNDKTLSKNYKFIPFGYKHNNPLAVISKASSESKQILNMFADFCKENGDALSKADGFNIEPEGYSELYTEYSGEELISAQEMYKENKDAEPVICVFVTDVSGSMVGEPLNTLKDSLINSMQYINKENYIGLVSYSSDVTIELPIAEFNLEQQSLFKGTVGELQANGGTATYDGLIVAMDMIMKQLKETPNAKSMVFVLSDGETNRGYSLSDVTDIISGLQIPVYTICYNDGDAKSLKQLSDINEGANINASTDDVTYQLKQLFNANM